MFESLVSWFVFRYSASLNMTMQGPYKKNREENKFSSRVEVRVVTPKKFGGC